VTKAAGANDSILVSGYLHPSGNQVTLIVLNTSGTDDTISLRFRGLSATTATAFRTRQFDINGFPYNSLGTVNLAGTLNPYNPALIRVDGMQHLGNQVSLTMPSQPSQRFVLWKSITLAAGSWQRVTNAVTSESDEEMFLTDPTPGSTRAFYRVEHD
jgi:hypothetical protein